MLCHVMLATKVVFSRRVSVGPYIWALRARLINEFMAAVCGDKCMYIYIVNVCGMCMRVHVCMSTCNCECAFESVRARSCVCLCVHMFRGLALLDPSMFSVRVTLLT